MNKHLTHLGYSLIETKIYYARKAVLQTKHCVTK